MKLDVFAKRLVCVGAAGLLALPAIAMADHHLEITAEVALEVDILLALDLPLVAHEARESGIEEQEIRIALSSALDGGLSAGSATEVVASEIDETRKNGEPRDAFGQWVRQQVASGVTGRELAQSIRERKTELAELSEEEQEELEQKLREQKEKRRAHRAALHDKRKELRADGKTIALRGKEEHEARKQALAANRGELLAAGKAIGAANRGGARGKAAARSAPGRDIAADRRDDRGPGSAPGKPDAPPAKADAAKGKANAADTKADVAKTKAADAGSKANEKANPGKGAPSKGKAGEAR